jgi:uncharacterized protein involved in high-affinity Fe2+ transport
VRPPAGASDMSKFPAVLALAAACALGASTVANAGEFYVGEPVVKSGLQIVPHYLLGIEMATMVPGMDMSKDAVHLEADIHAAKTEAHGLAEDTWIPYLTVQYTLTKVGSTFKKTGTLQPMLAGDGLHYANGVAMGGPGTYHMTYVISAPAIYRHSDKATGAKPWWAPITAEWNFTYPAKK